MCQNQNIFRPEWFVQLPIAEQQKEHFPKKKNFSFPPNNSPVYNDWIEKCNLDKNNLKKCLRVSADHFIDESRLGNRLKPGTIPSLNLANPSCLESDDDYFNIPDPIQLKRVYPNYSKVGSSSSYLTVEELEQYEPPSKLMCDIGQDKPLCSNCETQTKNCAYYRSEYYEIEKKLAILKKQIQEKNWNIRSLTLKARYLRKNTKLLKLKSRSSLSDRINNLTYVADHAKELGKMLLVRKPKTTKWSQPQRFIAQNLYFRSSRTYRYLKKSFQCRLPAVSSIRCWMPVKHLKPGINDDITNNLSKKCKDMDDNSRYAVIVYDEVDIRRDLEYNCYHDHIDGFTDLGNKRQKTIAKSICLFMIRGLFSNYKYILSYYSSKNNIKGVEIKEKLIENIDLAENCGFKIAAIVCDQGSNNRNCYSLLGISDDQPFFIHQNKKIYAMYDPSH